MMSSATHSAMCALGEAEGLQYGFLHTITMPDMAAYHVEEDAATRLKKILLLSVDKLLVSAIIAM